MILLRYIIGIILFLNIYTMVMGDLKKLSWRLKQNEKEELLEKFLMDAESHLMQNCPSRHTTVVASNNQLMRAATVIFKSRPYFVSIDPKILVKSREYVIESCVFVFVDTIDYDYLSTIFNHLPKHYGSKIQIVSTNNLPKNDIKNIFDLAYDKSIENVAITFLENSEFKEFQVHPFTRNCQREARLSHVWVLDKGLRTYNYHDYSLRNLNKCPVAISTMALKHVITVHENVDGTLDILGGLEGKLILAFAEKLNFTAVVKYPEVREWKSAVNNTIFGMMGDIANKKAIIAIGQVLTTLARKEYSDFTASYGHTSIMWVTPAITALTGDILYSEFDIYLWAAVVLLIIFSCIFIFILSTINSGNCKKQTCIAITLDLISATVGIPVHRLPTDRPGKIYFLSYIFYVTVAITTYQTFLASTLAVRKNVMLIKTEEDIVRTKLIPGGSGRIFALLESQREEYPYMPYLIDHFVILSDIEAAFERIKYKMDFAYATSHLAIDFYKQSLTFTGNEVYFHALDNCIVSYHPTVSVRKGSALTTELSYIIIKLRESGFIHLWKREHYNVDVGDTSESDVKLGKLNLKQLWSIFMLYLCGIIMSTVVLILEIIFHALSKRRN